MKTLSEELMESVKNEDAFRSFEERCRKKRWANVIRDEIPSEEQKDYFIKLYQSACAELKATIQSAAKNEGIPGLKNLSKTLKTHFSDWSKGETRIENEAFAAFAIQKMKEFLKTRTTRINKKLYTEIKLFSRRHPSLYKELLLRFPEEERKRLSFRETKQPTRLSDHEVLGQLIGGTVNNAQIRFSFSQALYRDFEDPRGRCFEKALEAVNVAVVTKRQDAKPLSDREKAVLNLLAKHYRFVLEALFFTGHIDKTNSWYQEAIPFENRAAS